MTRREINEKWRKANLAKIAARSKFRYNNDLAFRKRRQEWNKKYNKERYATDPNFRKTKFAAQLKLKYDLTLEAYNLLIKKQCNKCALCDKIRRLVVDHDHTTGRVRGLLCRKCNMWLSVFDNKTKFRKILKYLGRNRNEKGVLSV